MRPTAVNHTVKYMEHSKFSRKFLPVLEGIYKDQLSVRISLNNAELVLIHAQLIQVKYVQVHFDFAIFYFHFTKLRYKFTKAEQRNNF